VWGNYYAGIICENGTRRLYEEHELVRENSMRRLCGELEIIRGVSMREKYATSI
jgi:hypothetical protein